MALRSTPLREAIRRLEDDTAIAGACIGRDADEALRRIARLAAGLARAVRAR